MQTGLDGRILKVNQKFCEIVGYSDYELIQKTINEIIHVEDLEESEKIVRQLGSGLTNSLLTDIRFVNKDGKIIWGNLKSSLIRDINKKPVHLSFQTLDITDHKSIEADLQKATEKIRILTEEKSESIKTNTDHQISKEVSTHSYLSDQKISELFDSDKKPAYLSNKLMDLASYKQFDEVLKNCEKKYIELFENAPNGYLIVGLDRIIRKANKQAARLLKCSQSDLIEKHFIEFCASKLNTEDKIQNSFIAAATGIITKVEDIFISGDDNQTSWITLTFEPIFDSNGQVIECRIIVFDITALQETIEALEFSESIFSKMIDETKDGVILINEKGAITEWNNKQAEISGLKNKDVLGKALWDMQFKMLPPQKKNLEKYQRIKRMVLDYLQTGQATWLNQLFEHEIIRPDGGKRVIQTISFPIKLANSFVFGTIIHDITLERKIDKELRESQERYHRIVELYPDLVFVQTDNEIVYLNKVGSGKLGETYPDELLGKNLSEIFQSDSGDTIIDRIKNTQTTGEQFDFIEDKYYPFDGKAIDAEICGIPINYLGKPSVMVIMRDISERKQFNDKVKTADQKYDRLIQQINDIVFELDIEGIIKYITPGINTLIGASDEEVTGRSIYEFVYEEDLSVIRTLLNSVLIGKSQQCSFRLLKMSGIFHWAHLSISPIYSNSAKISGMQGIITDVHQIKQAEEIQNDTQNRYKQLIKYARTGIFEIDINLNKFVDVNDVLCEYTGYTKDEFLSFEPSSIITKETRSQFIDYFQKLRAKDKLPKVVEFKIRGKDEHEFWVKLNAEKILKHDQSNIVTIIVHDITDKKLIDEALHESEAKFRSIFETAANLITTLDEDGIIIDCNTRITDILGYDPKEIIGQPFANFFAPANRESMETILLEIIKKGASYNKEFQLVRNDGDSIEISLNSSSIKDENGKTARTICIIDEITERKKIEKKLRQTERMDTIGQLAGGIAHDFNNILTGIIGFAELAADSLPDDSDIGSYLKSIVNRSNDAANLVHQLLAFSRKQVLDIRLIDLNEVVTNSAKFLRQVLRDNIKITTKLNPKPGLIEADATTIDQMITKLCLNSQSAMEDGGQIEIDVESVSLDEQYCEKHTGVTPGEYVKLTVNDTGSGMTKKVLDHIYEPFFTTKAVGQSTGLGLSMVYGLVKQHQGHIECISEPGRGATFKLYFPLSKEVPITESVEEENGPYFGKETILIVEDDADVLTILKSILLRSGYTILVASNGKEALSMISSTDRVFDLVISDIVMPEMSGIELKQKMQELSIETEFIFISGYASTESEKFKLDSSIAFLQKPFTSKQLNNIVRETLEKKQ